MQSEQQNVPASVTQAKLVVLSSVWRKRISVNHTINAVQHARQLETSLQLHVDLAVHAATRKKACRRVLFGCLHFV